VRRSRRRTADVPGAGGRSGAVGGRLHHHSSPVRAEAPHSGRHIAVISTPGR
jgi:hypothetical protein